MDIWKQRRPSGAPLRTLDHRNPDEAAVCKLQTLLLLGVCLRGRPLVAVSRAVAAGWLAGGLGIDVLVLFISVLAGEVERERVVT